MIIIGLAGFAQSGKDTAAGFLKERGYQRLAFADILRQAVYELDPVIVADTYGGTFSAKEVIDEIGWEEAKSNHPEVRRLLQVLGTEVGRKLLGPDIWVDKVFAQMTDPDGKYVITDVRFSNEVHAIDKARGCVVKIDRPGVGPVNAHISDQGIADDNCCVVVHNIGSLTDLRTSILGTAEFIEAYQNW